MHTLHAFMHACYTIVYGRYIPALTLHRFEASSWGRAFRSCRAACLNCTNCAYISVSLVDSECSWSSACNLGRLKLRDKERFRTTLVRELEDSPDRQRLRQDSLFAGHPEITRNCAPHFPPSVLAHVKTLDAPQPLDAPRPLALRGVSIQAPLDHGVGWWGGSCRKLVGNHMHQLLNAILLSEIFNVPLLRQAAGHNYTCGGLLESTGKFEELPAHGQNAKPISWCGAGDLIKVVPSGEFKMRPDLHSMANCGNLVRWHAQEAAIFRLLPTGGNQRIFRHGPHYAFGQTFRRYFRFKGPDPHFKEDVLRIGVHLRHRRPCFNGSELVPAVLQLAKELAAGQKYMLLVASDRRLSIQLLRASGGLVKSVPRDGKASETAVFAENGEDVGYVSLQDIRLLSFIGTTLLAPPYCAPPYWHVRLDIHHVGSRAGCIFSAAIDRHLLRARYRLHHAPALAGRLALFASKLAKGDHRSTSHVSRRQWRQVTLAKEVSRSRFLAAQEEPPTSASGNNTAVTATASLAPQRPGAPHAEAPWPLWGNGRRRSRKTVLEYDARRLDFADPIQAVMANCCA
jgi:hypothetical protein